MRTFWPFLLAGLLLLTGLLVGCNQQTPRMKNQPPTEQLDPGTDDFFRPKPGGEKKLFPGAK